MNQQDLDFLRAGHEQPQEGQARTNSARSTAHGNQKIARPAEQPGLHHADGEHLTAAITEQLLRHRARQKPATSLPYPGTAHQIVFGIRRNEGEMWIVPTTGSV